MSDPTSKWQQYSYSYIESREMALIAEDAAKWVRDPTPVTVKVAERLNESVHVEVIITNEGYSTEEDQIIINEECSISGKLRAKEDGSVFVMASSGDPNDASCKYTYNLAPSVRQLNGI